MRLVNASAPTGCYIFERAALMDGISWVVRKSSRSPAMAGVADASAAEQHASEMSTQINAARRRPHHYRFEHRRVVLPWGETFAVVVANLADQVAMGPIRD